MTADTDVNFVLFTTNRSGSEWVLSTLNNFQNVSAHGELFLARPRGSGNKWDSDFAYVRFVESKSVGVKFRPFSVFAYLDAFYRMPGTVGFKLMYKQLGFYPEILVYLIKRRLRVVHLVRRNHLDVMLSYAVKAELGQSHLLVGQSAPGELRVQLDTGTLVRKLAWLQKQQNIARILLNWSGLSHLEIAYEDLVRDPGCFHQIGDFLAVNSREQIPQSTLARIRRAGHREVISNYDQVRQILVNSKFAGLLE